MALRCQRINIWKWRAKIWNERKPMCNVSIAFENFPHISILFNINRDERIACENCTICKKRLWDFFGSFFPTFCGSMCFWKCPRWSYFCACFSKNKGPACRTNSKVLRVKAQLEVNRKTIVMYFKQCSTYLFYSSTKKWGLHFCQRQSLWTGTNTAVFGGHQSLHLL